jgi:hypothetical protein
MMRHGGMRSMTASMTRVMDACTALMQAKARPSQDEEAPNTTP